MSGVAGVYNIPEDQKTLNEWTFNHYGHHQDINDAIFRLHGVRLPIYPMDPVTPENMSVFLYQHALMHTNQNQVLGIVGVNLLDVDWNNMVERGVWINLNGSEHLQASRILGI